MVFIHLPVRPVWKIPTESQTVRFGQELCLMMHHHFFLFSSPSIHPNSGIISQNGIKVLGRHKAPTVIMKVRANIILLKKNKCLHQRKRNQIAFCVLSPFECKIYPLPFLSRRGCWKCVLALIPCVRLGVVRACSRHDSHCGVCSLCLWNKAACVV